MSSSREFYRDYILLKPLEATTLELVFLLFSSYLANRKFIECTEGLKAEKFSQRLLLFCSVIVQRVLLFANPILKIVGYTAELCLNHIVCNGGFIKLFSNILKGNMRTIDKSSPEFLSMLGYFDTRVDLGNNINQNATTYKASLAMMASKFSYENEPFISSSVTNHWGMNFVGFYRFRNDYQESQATTSIIVQDTKSEPNLIVVAFRGTQLFDAEQLSSDFDISWFEFPDVGKIHSGFMKALGIQKNMGWPKEIEETGPHRYAYYTIREVLRAMIDKNGNSKIIVTGHSLGGALAILFVAVLIIHEETSLLGKIEGVYTFGQPRVGDMNFGEFMKDNLSWFDIKYMRYVYCNDVVPRIPFDDESFFFKHFSPCLYFNSLYQGKVLEEAPNKNYFSLFWAIPKYLNAIWELVRGFLLPLVKGREYAETWVLTSLRLIGLMFPGLSAHFPPDYVNITRLGSLNEIPEIQGSQRHKLD